MRPARLSAAPESNPRGVLNVKVLPRIGLVALALALSACAIIEGDKVDYKSAG